MPELPDVEVFKKYLDSTALKKTIKKVEIKNNKILEKTTEKKFIKNVTGKKFTDSKRHGKYLFVSLNDDFWIMMHFGMTGFLKYFKNPEDEPSHSRILFSLDNNYFLSYDCQRLLGKVKLVEDLDKYIEEKKLGPDALDLTFETFKNIFENKRGGVKSAFMNQKNIAGIGNIYSDEILFQTGIHPKSKVKKLKEETLENLYKNMKKVLKTAVDSNADPDDFPDDFVIPHRNKNDKCPIDGTKLKKIKVNNRGTYFCPKHQNKN